MKINSIDIKSFKCFKNVSINCLNSENKTFQWTVLLGNNNTGKTSILKAIANLGASELPAISRGNIDSDSNSRKYVPFAFFNDEFGGELNDESLVGCKISMSPDPNYFWRYNNSRVSVSDEWIKPFQIYGYGVSRYPSQAKLTETVIDNSATLFSPDKKLINLEEWLMQLDYASKNENQLAVKRLYRVEELLCSGLFPEIISFKMQSNEYLQNHVLFQTKDGWFRYPQLGYGYQSMLSWVVDLCKKMFDRYPNSENPLAESAIVLVDEIDLHLHPKWQRDVIPFLSKVFPNIQFIVTTHSPLVLQSMENVNLYVLRRDNDGVFAEKIPQTDFRGWTVEEILRDVMKMDDDIYSDLYQRYFREFEEGLNAKNYQIAFDAYSELKKSLHPNNPLRRILEIQLNQLDKND